MSHWLSLPELTDIWFLGGDNNIREKRKHPAFYVKLRVKVPPIVTHQSVRNLFSTFDPSGEQRSGIIWWSIWYFINVSLMFYGPCCMQSHSESSTKSTRHRQLRSYTMNQRRKLFPSSVLTAIYHIWADPFTKTFSSWTTLWAAT